MGDAYSRAEGLIAENRGRLELIAKTLMEKETMDGSEVRALIGMDAADGGGKEQHADA